MKGREHGTETGYSQHRRESEQACGHCLWAHRIYNQQSREQVKTRKLKPRPLVVDRPAIKPLLVLHGSPQALELHTRSSRPICEPCLTAVCDWERAEAARYLRRLRVAS